VRLNADELTSRLDVLACLPDEQVIEVVNRLPVGDLRRMGAPVRAPEWVTTTWCAQHLGFSSRKWRHWCESGEVSGALKDTAQRWRLPSRNAREHFEAILHSGHTAELEGPRLVPDGPEFPTHRRRRRSGPWKRQASESGRP